MIARSYTQIKKIRFKNYKLLNIRLNIYTLTFMYLYCYYPASILYKSIAGRYRAVRVADGPITARCKFIKNANWVYSLGEHEEHLTLSRGLGRMQSPKLHSCTWKDLLNPFMSSGLFYHTSLDRSTSNRRSVWLVFITTIFYRKSYI